MGETKNTLILESSRAQNPSENSPLIDSAEWPNLWTSAYHLLEQSVVPNQLKTWIDPLELIESESKNEEFVIHFRAPNDFIANWVRDHYQDKLNVALTQVAGHPCSVDIQSNNETEGVKTAAAKESPEHSFSLNHLSATASSRSGGSPSSHSVMPEFSLPPSTTIDSRYVFENFVVGPSNQFAHASAVAVAERPGNQYNPLFIYSPPGLGKTHLLYAIGNLILKKNPNKKVAYLSAEAFVNELIESIQHHRMSEFREKYRSRYEVLLIDDIQFIAGRVKTEEEFFHTFNALHSLKRQIVLTSDRPPKEIKNLEDRIRTRFEWGLVADIQPPEIETRIAILKAKAEWEDIYLPDEVATFLATHVKSSVRELEGILVRLQAQASLSGSEISLEMAKTELHLSIPEESAQLTVEAIQNAVIKHFNISNQELRSSTRTKNIAMARQIAMFLIRRYTQLGFKEIGQYFGGKDHTTIIHAYKKMSLLAETDEEIKKHVLGIQSQL